MANHKRTSHINDNLYRATCAECGASSGGLVRCYECAVDYRDAQIAREIEAERADASQAWYDAGQLRRLLLGRKGRSLSNDRRRTAIRHQQTRGSS